MVKNCNSVYSGNNRTSLSRYWYDIFSASIQSTLCICGLLMGFLPAIAFSDDRLRVVVSDTGIDSSIPAINAVMCPTEEQLDLTGGHAGDVVGHGTHVAGTIRALAGTTGYCIVSCKWYDEDVPGMINAHRSTDCFTKAKALHAAYVNYSAGGGEFEEVEQQAIAALTGVRVIVAAGNDGIDLGKPGNKFYPASYRLPNMLVVGALDTMCDRAVKSNYGSIVNVFALGSVLSVIPGGKLQYMSGSSMATAVTTGILLRKQLGLPSLGKDCHAYTRYLNNFWHNL